MKATKALLINDNRERGKPEEVPSLSARPSVSFRWLPYVLALAVISYWLLVKSVLFDRLEYTSDLFGNLELSRSVFEGRPLLWENQFGNHKAFHNLYIAVLLYPLTRFLGAYGLFVAQALLSGWAVYMVLGRARDTAEWKRWLYWAAVVALALGPVAFWICDDPLYGFHYELLFVPLSVLFALSLSKRSRSAWLFAGLIVLTREEGPVVAWCIHVLHEVFSAEPGIRDGKARSTLFRRLAWVTLGWLLVFIAGMSLLVTMGATSHGRLGSTMPGVRALLEDATTRSALLASVLDAALLLAAGGLVYLAGIPRRGLIASALISVVLIIPLTVASSFYKSTGLRDLGLAWPPRFAMLWGVALVGCLFAIERARAPALAASRRRRAVAIAVAASIVAQIAVLGVRRRYDFVSRITLQAFFVPNFLIALIVRRSTFQDYLSRPRFIAAALSGSEDAFLTCLGRELPQETPVTSTGTLFGRFHRQDLLWPYSLATAWKPPELVVCDEAGRGPPLLEYGCLKLAHSLSTTSYETVQVGRLLVRYSGGPKAIVEACAARSAPADSPGRQP
jgi:hypothetical protein